MRKYDQAPTEIKERGQQESHGRHEERRDGHGAFEWVIHFELKSAFVKLTNELATTGDESRPKVWPKE